MANSNGKDGERNEFAELMANWEQKEPITKTYKVDKQEKEITINHKENFFIPDGIVNEEKWEKLPFEKRILFILKEAYEDDHNKGKWSLNEELNKSGPWSTIWYRVCEWTYGILKSSDKEIEKFGPYEKNNEDMCDIIRNIAVMNIKKSGGESKSTYEEISAYAYADREEIVREIELIDPGIIVCGSTFKDINRITDNKIKKEKESNDNWFYYSDAIGNKKRLYIDYYHPANRYPALLSYYGIVGIYQQAMKEK